MAVKAKAQKAKTSSPHPCHKNSVHRLNRAIGQLEGVRRMIEDERYCPDILTQTAAVKAALKSLESSILKKHLEHCVHGAFQSKNKRDTEEKIEELLKLFQKAT